MKKKLQILLSLFLVINALAFSKISRYDPATFGLLNFIIIETGLILSLLVELSYSEGFKVSFAILSMILGVSQILVTIICALFSYLHIASIFILVILFFEMLFMILYFKNRQLYGN
jgi:hypothetical protein